MQPILITLLVVVPVFAIGTWAYLRWHTFWTSGHHKKRWILPIASIAPVLLGLVALTTVRGAPDQGAGDAMGLVFLIFPISFVMSVISAIRAWKNWRSWPSVDRLVGVLPLGVFLTLIFVTLIIVVLF